ncbi:MAG: peptidase S8, partial [Rubrobacteraceae bacterium]
MFDFITRTRCLASATLLAVALLVGASSVGAAPDELAFVDPLLEERLSEAGGSAQAVVTFEGEGAPEETQVELLNELGIDSGVTFRSLPIAGVLANEEQVRELAESPEVRSVYLNREIEYENKEATEITGVDRVRTDENLTRNNGGDPISGAGVGVLVNDSGIDGT